MHSTTNSQHQPVRRTVDLHELETRAADIVREVRESGEPIDVTDGDDIVVRIAPTNGTAKKQPPRFATMEEWLSATQALS